MLKSSVTVYFLAMIWSTDSARILGVYHFPSYSHYQLGDAIFKELARRGHEMTVISPFEDKAPIKNFEQVIVNGVLKLATELKQNLFDFGQYNIMKQIMWMDTMGINFTELALNSSNVQQFLKKENHFDLVIIHHFMSDALNGFCYHFKAPCISISSFATPNLFSNKVGLSVPPSYVSQLFMSYSSKMNYWQRFQNAIVYILVAFSEHFYHYPSQTRLLQKYFPEAPHLDELYYNVSLILYNDHVSIGDVTQLLPNTIDIAGYHVKPPKGLPDDLKKYLDNAPDGVIYFSMGSNLKSKDIPIDKVNALLNVFSKLKQSVLLKWEDEFLPNKPDNVLIRSWFPQPDILAHPNVVLFITHGGLLSTIEAVYHGKPILGLPVYADQGNNAERAQTYGYGRYIPFAELNENNFRKELHEVLFNSKYAINSKIRSNIMHDQPLAPLDKAIFWIEYVLRHKGAPHLKSSAVYLTWYQYFLLDVVFMVVLCCVLIVFLIKCIIFRIFSIHKCNKNKNKTKIN